MGEELGGVEPDRVLEAESLAWDQWHSLTGLDMAMQCSLLLPKYMHINTNTLLHVPMYMQEHGVHGAKTHFCRSAPLCMRLPSLAANKNCSTLALVQYFICKVTSTQKLLNKCKVFASKMYFYLKIEVLK